MGKVEEILNTKAIVRIMISIIKSKLVRAPVQPLIKQIDS